MRRSVVAIAIALSPIPAAAGSLRAPEGFGPTALVVVRLGPSVAHPTEYYCPPEEPASEDMESICLGGSLLDGRGRIVAVLADDGRPFDRSTRRFRRIGGHAVRRVSGGAVLALAEQTPQGRVWLPWNAVVARNRACIPVAVMTQFAIRLDRPLTPGEHGSTCIDVVSRR